MAEVQLEQASACWPALTAEIPRLRRFARSMIGDALRADVLAGQCLTQSAANIRSDHPDTNLRTWIFFNFMNLYNHVNKREMVQGEQAKVTKKPKICACENDTKRRPNISQVEAALMKMDAGYRALLLLAVTEGMPHAEVAHILNIPASSVGSRLARTRVTLRGLVQAARTGEMMQV